MRENLKKYGRTILFGKKFMRCLNYIENLTILQYLEGKIFCSLILEVTLF